VLGTLPAVLVAFLGLQAGKVLLHFREEGHAHVIVRWVLWAGLCGGSAVLLHLTGIDPSSPALGNISCALAAVCFWQSCFVVFYTVMDVLRCGARVSSAMFLRCMGQNSLLIYIIWTLLPELCRFPYAGTNSSLLMLLNVFNVAG
jgi:heparan-alpha-glucosaminide N-acetyltransferase